MSTTNMAARAVATEMLRKERQGEVKARTKAMNIGFDAALKRRSSSIDLLKTDDIFNFTESTEEMYKKAERTADAGGQKFSLAKLFEHREFFMSVATDRQGSSPRIPLKTCRQLQKANNPKFPRQNLKRIISESKAPDAKSISFRMLLPFWYPGMSKNQISWVMKVAFPPTVEKPPPSAIVRRQMQALFKGWDTNGDGVISHPELCAALTDMGYTDRDVETLFELSDTDHNQFVDFQEFQQMMSDFISAA